MLKWSIADVFSCALVTVTVFAKMLLTFTTSLPILIKSFWDNPSTRFNFNFVSVKENPTWSTSAIKYCVLTEPLERCKEEFENVTESPFLYPIPLDVITTLETNPEITVTVALALLEPPIFPNTAFVLDEPTILPSISLHFVWSAKIISTLVKVWLPLLA